MKWIILSTLTLIAWVVFYLFIHLGFSRPVTVEVTESAPMVLIFKEHTGPYHQIGPLIQEIEKQLAMRQILCPLTFGEYLDNPNNVTEDRLKSNGGCVFEQSSPALEALARELGLTLREVGPMRVVKAVFEGAPSIGPLKVYPKIDEAILAQRLVRQGAIFEIYRIQGDQVTTTYMQPVGP